MAQESERTHANSGPMGLHQVEQGNVRLQVGYGPYVAGGETDYSTLRMSRKANAGAASAGKKMYCFLEQKMLEFAYFGDLDAIDGRRSARSNYTFKSRCKAVLYLLPTGALLNSVLCLITGARSRLCLPVGRHDRAHPLQARMHVAKRLLQRSCILCSIPT